MYADLEKDIQAFISSCLDFCHSICCCLIQNSLWWIRLVQNVAARIFTSSRMSDHIATITYHSVSEMISKYYWSCSRLNQAWPQTTSCELLTSYEPNHSMAVPRSRLVTTDDSLRCQGSPALECRAGLTLVCYFSVNFQVPLKTYSIESISYSTFSVLVSSGFDIYYILSFVCIEVFLSRLIRYCLLNVHILIFICSVKHFVTDEDYYICICIWIFFLLCSL